MKITVTTTAQKLKDIVWAGDLHVLSPKGKEFTTLNIQNLGDKDVYLDNDGDASVSESYKLTVWNEVEIKTLIETELSLIADGGNNTDIRILTT